MGKQLLPVNTTEPGSAEEAAETLMLEKLTGLNEQIEQARARHLIGRKAVGVLKYSYYYEIGTPFLTIKYKAGPCTLDPKGDRYGPVLYVGSKEDVTAFLAACADLIRPYAPEIVYLADNRTVDDLALASGKIVHAVESRGNALCGIFGRIPCTKTGAALS